MQLKNFCKPSRINIKKKKKKTGIEQFKLHNIAVLILVVKKIEGVWVTKRYLFFFFFFAHKTVWLFETAIYLLRSAPNAHKKYLVVRRQ